MIPSQSSQKLKHAEERQTLEICKFDYIIAISKVIYYLFVGLKFSIVSAKPLVLNNRPFNSCNLSGINGFVL